MTTRERQKRSDVKSSVCDVEEHSWTSKPDHWDRGARGGGWEREELCFLFFFFSFLHTGDKIKKRKKKETTTLRIYRKLTIKLRQLYTFKDHICNGAFFFFKYLDF